MRAPPIPRSTDSTKAQDVDSRPGRGPSDWRRHDASGQSSNVARSVSRPPDVAIGLRSSVSGPSRTPHLGDRIASSHPPPSTLSVGYATSPPENRRVRRSSTTAEPWPPSPLSKERSARSASLGDQARRESHHGSHATRRCGRPGHNRGGKFLPLLRGRVDSRDRGCMVVLPRERLHRPLGGVVRSGQSDIEATSGAELVSPRERRPHMLAFQSGETHRIPSALRTDQGLSSSRKTRDSPRPRRRIVGNQPDETITGRTRPA